VNVIHLPTSVAGNSWGLSRGERRLGLRSDVLALYPVVYGYPADRFIFNSAPSSSAGKMALRLYFPRLLREIAAIRKTYDVFHFNFGTTLLDLWMFGLPLLDLPFYQGKGKIVVTYNGCDARQKYPTIRRTAFSACQRVDCSRFCTTGIPDVINRMRIRKFDRYANAIFAMNPDIMHFLPERAQYLPYTIPYWYNITTDPFSPAGKILKIAHAPTNRATKGSAIIIEALDKAKQIYGDRLELILVENMPHEQALERYREADMVIDQILVGFYGGFAVEAMKMGKPVMVYIRHEDLRFIPAAMAEESGEAFIHAEPSTIFERLCDIIENPSQLKCYYDAGLAYVNRWHDPVYAAGITKAAYERVL